MEINPSKSNSAAQISKSETQVPAQSMEEKNVEGVVVDESAKDLSKDEIQLDKMFLSTKEIMAEMQWFIDIYYKLGEHEATGIKIIRDDATDTNWNASSLNKKRREFVKNASKVIDGNYGKLSSKIKKPKKHRAVKEGEMHNVFLPKQVSQNVVDFFNACDLGELEHKGSKARLQSFITGLNSKERLMSTSLISSLLYLWMERTPIVADGVVVSERLIYNKKLMIVNQPEFLQCFGDIVKNLKNKAVENEEVVFVLRDGTEKSLVVEYQVPTHSRFVMTASAKFVTQAVIKEAPNDKDQKNLRLMYKRLMDERAVVEHAIDTLRGK